MRIKIRCLRRNDLERQIWGIPNLILLQQPTNLTFPAHLILLATLVASGNHQSHHYLQLFIFNGTVIGLLDF